MDRIDFAILRHLQNDGRLPNKSLAARVGLAASSCFERVRQLRQRGIIRGVHAEVDPAALGIGLEAMYLVTLNKHSRATLQEFQQAMQALKEVRAVFLVTGRFDYMLHVAVRDTAHLRDLALDEINRRPEVTGIETVLIFEHSRNFVLPDLTDDPATPAAR